MPPVPPSIGLGEETQVIEATVASSLHGHACSCLSHASSTSWPTQHVQLRQATKDALHRHIAPFTSHLHPNWWSLAGPLPRPARVASGALCATPVHLAACMSNEMPHCAALTACLMFCGDLNRSQLRLGTTAEITSFRHNSRDLYCWLHKNRACKSRA